MELLAQKAIEISIGQAVVNVAIDSSAPTMAPIPKRNVPASEEAVPAICGNSSRITAIALEETIETQPMNAATPNTSAQNPTPNSAHTTIHAAIANWIHSPARNMFSALTRRTKRLLIMVMTNRKTTFSAK